MGAFIFATPRSYTLTREAFQGQFPLPVFLGTVIYHYVSLGAIVCHRRGSTRIHSHDFDSELRATPGGFSGKRDGGLLGFTESLDRLVDSLVPGLEPEEKPPMMGAFLIVVH